MSSHAPAATAERPIVVKVRMLAFGKGGIRPVSIPAGLWHESVANRHGAVRDAICLELAFAFGQNENQPLPLPSVGVGDVIILPDKREFVCLSSGFQEVL